jgi:hypothetical protein
VAADYTKGERAEQKGSGYRVLYLYKNMASTFKILPQLDDKNRSRLEAKSYTRAYTDIPNRALPESYRLGLATIFKALTGEDFDPETSTFTVKADPSGTFQRLYSPTIFSTEEGGLVIRWGERDIPLLVAPGKIGVANAPKGTKFAFKDEQIGKYTEPVLSVSASSDGTLYTLPISIRKKDIKEEISADLLDLLLDEKPEAIAEKVYAAPDLSKRGESTGERLVGPFIKVAHLPLGEYLVTNYRVKEGGTYGTDYFLQVQVTEPFVAPVRTQVDGEWIDQDTEVSDWAVVRPNSAMKKILAAEPLISPDSPATLRVIEHFEYNNNPAAKVALKCPNFVQNADSFALDF